MTRKPLVIPDLPPLWDTPAPYASWKPLISGPGGAPIPIEDSTSPMTAVTTGCGRMPLMTQAGC
jgi:hypothetical protein